MSVFFAFIAFARMRHGFRFESIRLWALSLSLLFLVATLVAPSSLRVLSQQWLKLGKLISKVTNPLVLGLFYFAIFTPIAWIARIFGHDPLELGFDQRRATYWVARKPLQKDFMEKPF